MLVEIERQLIFQVLPESLDRIELWAVGRKKRQLDVGRDRELVRLMKLAVIQNHYVVASRKRLRKPILEVLEAVAVETLMFGKKTAVQFPAQRPRRDRSTRRRASGLNRLHARQGNSMPNRWHQPNSAFVLTEQAHGRVGI